MAHFGTACRARLVLALFLLGGYAASPASAQDQREIFTVSGIEVDVVAADAVTARREALLSGQRAGLERLLRRLVSGDAYEDLPALQGLPIEQYVQNFTIRNEEASGTQYIAELTVMYAPEQVRALLREQGLPFAEAASAPLMVLPLYEGPEGARLWPDENPWWQAWDEHLDQERLLRLNLPLGDLEDMTRVSLAQARAGDVDALLDLAARYDSEDVLVVIATVQQSGSDAEVPIVRLEAHRFGEVERTGEPLTLRGESGQSLEDLLGEAVRRLQDNLDERWKSANLLRFDEAGLMVVDIPIDALSDWVRIDRGLQSLPEVGEVDVAAFSRRNVRAEIRYLGDELRLEEAFLRLGLTLSREGDTWLLQPTGASPDPGGPLNARPARSSSGPR